MNIQEVRSFAFWAYKGGNFIFEKSPSDTYWSNTNMIGHFSTKGTEKEFNKMEEESVNWCTSSLGGVDTVLFYLDLLEKEIGTFQNSTEDESIKKYIVKTVLEFFRAWESVKFDCKMFRNYDIYKKEGKFGNNLISPATKLKLLYDKYKEFAEENEKLEFDQLISSFKKVLPLYKNADLEIHKRTLQCLEKQKEELEERIRNVTKDIEVFVPKNYDQTWLNRLN